MRIEELMPVCVDVAADRPEVAWAEGMRFRLPRATLHRLGLTEAVASGGRWRIPSPPLAPQPEESEGLRLFAAFPDRKPVSSRLPVSYQKIPPWLRSLIGAAIGRWQRRHVDRWATFPGWPVDLSADFLADLAGCPPSPFANGPTPVVLTHDLDSPEGLRHVVKWFVGLEENVGARSSHYVVPCAWPIDHGCLRELESRGHEVGIHGYDHSNRTPFTVAAERLARLQAAKRLIDTYGVMGYRSPSLLRTRALLRDLARFYLYDSSIPTSGGCFPVPNNGCASARPFWVEGIAELPLSLPRDGSLRFLGYTPAQILETWIRCADDIARSGGVVVLLTHGESRFSGNPPMLTVYQQFLEYIAASRRFAWSTPREVLTTAFGRNGNGARRFPRHHIHRS